MSQHATTAAGLATPLVTSPSRWRRLAFGIRRSPSAMIGGAIIALYLLMAVFGSWLIPFEPNAVLTGRPLEPPSRAHWFGTDGVGADVFSRTVAAASLNLRITALAVGIALAIGVTIGTFAGYFGGVVDLVLLRLMEILQAIPTLLLAMVVVVALGPGEQNVIAVLVFLGIPYYVRLVRAEMMSKRNWEFAEAARMVGGSRLRVAFRHLLPNCMSPALAYTSVNAAWAVLVTASLSFLGIGIEPGTAEWGAMISRGQTNIVTGEWWVSVFPGLAILLLTAGFYLLGDGVRDLMARGQR